MKLFLAKSYRLFWALIPLVFMYGLFNKEHFSSINIGATYIVFSDLTFSEAVAVLFALFGLGYWVMDMLNKELVKWMTAYHVYISIIGLLILLFFHSYFQELETDDAFKESLMMLILIAAAVTLAAQLLFPLNLIVSYFRDKRR